MRDNSRRVSPSTQEQENVSSEQPSYFSKGDFSFFEEEFSEMVELPSLGKYYPENHPLHNVSTIDIKTPTTKEQNILINKSFIKKGVVFDKLLESVIANKMISVNSLLLGDKEFLIKKVRSMMFGSDYETNVVCPICELKTVLSVDLDKSEIFNPYSDEKLSELGVTRLNIGGETVFEINLPKWNFPVRIRLLTSRDQNVLKEINEQKKKNRVSVSPISDQLFRILVSVKGFSSDEAKIEFINKAPSEATSFIQAMHDTIQPGIRIVSKLSCVHCYHEDSDFEVPLTTDFFRPKQTRRH